MSTFTLQEHIILSLTGPPSGTLYGPEIILNNNRSKSRSPSHSLCTGVWLITTQWVKVFQTNVKEHEMYMVPVIV
jgi:hypothetical protein